MKYVLEVDNLTKKYKGFMLDKVSFNLPKGCVMGFIGENGAGKTTTIKSILNLIAKDGGSIKIFEQDNGSPLKSLNEHIGVVQDETCIPDNLNSYEAGKIMSHMYKTWNKKTYESMCTRFGIMDDKPVKEYSRGMKMKLQIAIALSHDSRLLILDEATSGLDPIVREDVLDIFLEFIQDENHSILMSSHILSDLEKICDYITFIHKGKIIFSEQKDMLLEKYGLLKCTKEEFNRIDKLALRGYRMNQFGVEALVERKFLKGNYVVDKANIEDIMIYRSKEEAV